mgnify:CR=1 FL=1
MERQKRVAVIHDLAGYGRCALAVALPVISAEGLECCVLPTSILSSNAAFPGYYRDDGTERMERFLSHWDELDLEFDGIYVGYLGSAAGIELAAEFLKRFRRENTIVLFDPVMGDHGRLYSACSPEVCEKMEDLLAYSDVITPNLTEAYRLAGLEYPDEHPSGEALWELEERLCAKGPSEVVLTGIAEGEDLVNQICSRDGSRSRIPARRSGGDRCGTGDVFASIVFAEIVRGRGTEQAVKKAAGFLEEAIAYTEQSKVPSRNGVCFEPFLYRLIQ